MIMKVIVVDKVWEELMVLMFLIISNKVVMMNVFLMIIGCFFRWLISG